MRRIVYWDGLVVGYFSECMTGFTYQAAAHMISEGLVKEGLALCRSIHDRYAEAPLRRNPFNEIEYGNHYTRSMSCFAPFMSISGFEFHGPKKHIGFAPRIQSDQFKCAFVAADGWGTFDQVISESKMVATITLKWGSLQLESISLQIPEKFNCKSVQIGANQWQGRSISQHSWEASHTS